jgi:hypothetical protein
MELLLVGDVHENEVSKMQWLDKCGDKKGENVAVLKYGSKPPNMFL